MKILIINCSPVRTGATAEIVRMAEEILMPGNDVHSVCIDDYSVGLCRGCRSCHKTGRCFQKDGADGLMGEFAWADSILCVSPSYWADVPGQFKAFIDRCTPWCNTHEPHAALPSGKKGYTIALRTGSGMPECQRIIQTVEHFYGHLEIQASGHLGLCSVENREDAAARRGEIREFCRGIRGKILAACGNDCACCPRYVKAPYEKTPEQLRHTAELWYKIGYRDHIVTEEEISCTGCRKENWCRYQVAVCSAEKGIEHCGACPQYPCGNIQSCFRVTESFRPACREVCTPEEYEMFQKAFFEKEKNLGGYDAPIR